MEVYDGIPFLLEDGSYDKTPCPRRNTEVFLKHGLKQDDSQQILPGGILILPSVYLSPIDAEMKIRRYSRKTISIHWFDSSWMTPEEKNQYAKNARRERIDRPVYYLKLKLKQLLGNLVYDQIKKMVRRGD